MESLLIIGLFLCAVAVLAATLRLRLMLHKEHQCCLRLIELCRRHGIDPRETWEAVFPEEPCPFSRFPPGVPYGPPDSERRRV